MTTDLITETPQLPLPATGSKCESTQSPSNALSAMDAMALNTPSTLVGMLQSISDHLARLNADRKLMDDLHAQCRNHAENTHLNEVILPIARALIGIADRCRQGNAELRERGRCASDHHLRRCLSFAIEARHADRVELEELLHILGVRSFRSPFNRFDPALQKCIDRIDTSVPEAHLTIARRLLPGYQHGKVIVRPELVNVHVCPSIPPSPISRS